ncbi:MAG TPA: phosphatase PAP2 family protein [Verrucomicrobiae bacterium]|nr:phosphatase PAP2 family protein [Verrucomicrobiae bacterium]
MLCVAVVVGPLHADDASYLQPGQVDPIAILPPPPAPDSVEQTVDLATVESVQKAASVADRAAANSQEHLTVFAFAPVIGAFFRASTLPKTEAFFGRVAATAESMTRPAKAYFKRDRPYVVDPNLGVKHPEHNYSYPRGHSTLGTVDALVLADLFPDKRAEILAFGRAIGWHRIQLGKHYPTDVYAGRVLAQAIVRELKSSPAFQHDFAAAKSELEAASPPTHSSP